MTEDKSSATLLITATDFTPYPPEYYENGVRVILCDFRQTGADPLCGHKTTNYFARLLALRKAHEKQAAESIWFTTDNRLAEGCISNVFIVKDSILLTPPLTTPVLNGIARRTVCEIAIEQRIELKEKDLTVEDLLAADEIFITNVIMMAMPVSSVESHTIADGKPGAITKDILETFRRIVTDTKQPEGTQ
jgi:branched-subunit amino acid aminotransferase/4-amino-4-deoxychorismate lyase